MTIPNRSRRALSIPRVAHVPMTPLTGEKRKKPRKKPWKNTKISVILFRIRLGAYSNETIIVPGRSRRALSIPGVTHPPVTSFTEEKGQKPRKNTKIAVISLRIRLGKYSNGYLPKWFFWNGFHVFIFHSWSSRILIRAISIVACYCLIQPHCYSENNLCFYHDFFLFSLFIIHLVWWHLDVSRTYHAPEENTSFDLEKISLFSLFNRQRKDKDDTER